MSYGYLHATLAAVRDSAADVGQVPAELPVLLVAGERDPVGNATQAVRDLAALLKETGRTVTEIYYPDARHEVLNELNRDEVEADIVAWVNEVIAR
jgi:alpha-beta hydrolase superfamily lysophospholipase